MKNKAIIIYIILNLILIGTTGFLVYRQLFPPVITYPDPVTLFSEELEYGKKLNLMDPAFIDVNDSASTYHFTITNNTETEKTYYLFLDVSGDEILFSSLVIKIKDKNLLISYQPNNSLKTVTLAPSASLDFTVKIYLDISQVLMQDTVLFAGTQITVTITDDYARFYNLNADPETEKNPEKNPEITPVPYTDTTE